jgi:hypothetical protein
MSETSSRSDVDGGRADRRDRLLLELAWARARRRARRSGVRLPRSLPVPEQRAHSADVVEFTG